MKEVKNINRDTFDRKQLFGVEALKKSASCEKSD
jgi:hypothetical protein